MEIELFKQFWMKKVITPKKGEGEFSVCLPDSTKDDNFIKMIKRASEDEEWPILEQN